MKISIVIPAFNEQNRIKKTIEAILNYTKEQKDYSFEIIVVNDGSKDKTEEKVRAYPEVRLVSYLVNKGKGYALRQGAAKASGDFVYICDADLSSPISEIEKFLTHARKYDCVIGSRAATGAKENSSKMRILLGKFGNLFINFFLNLGIKDTQCGFKLMNRSAKMSLLQCTINRWGYDFEFLYLLKKNNLKVSEIPVNWVAAGESKMKPVHYLNTLFELIKVWRKYVGFSKEFWLGIWANYGSFIRYFIVGLGTNLFNLVVFFFLLHYVRIGDFVLSSSLTIQNYQVIESIAYILTIILNFSFHKLWTFKSNGSFMGEIGRYGVMIVVNFIASISIITVLVEWFHVYVEIAKVLSIAAIMVWNFFALKLFVYRKKVR